MTHRIDGVEWDVDWIEPRRRFALDPVRMTRIRALLRGGRTLAAQRALLRTLTRR